MRRWLVTVAGAAALTTLALAGPAQADDNADGFYAYLDLHGYNYSNPYGDRSSALYSGRFFCQYPDLVRSRASVNGNLQVGLVIEAAEHELCRSIPPAQDGAGGFFAYLDSHGYNYANPYGSRDQALMIGRGACEYPDTARTTPNGNPQYALILEAAQHELCRSIPPAHDSAGGFFAYLDSHGYNYANPYGSRDQALMIGRGVCEYPDRARDNTTNGNPQYGLIVEAAGHELCPNKLAGQ